MRNLKEIILKLYQTRFTPYAIVGLALVFSATVAFSFSPQSPLFKNHSAVQAISKVETSKISGNTVDKNTLLPTPTETPSNNVLGAKTTVILPTPKVSIEPKTPVPTQVSNQTNSTNPTTQNNSSDQNQVANTPQQSTQPIPTLSPTPTSPPVVVTTVNVEIKTPDSPSSFSVELKEGMTVCDVLQKAKDDGKISSLTLDDSYMSSLHSKYVYEINGYKNNWTFTVNGSSPLGCSLSNPKPNDTIVWKFL